MNTGYSLADHVYAAHFEDGAVLLDLRSDRYLALDDRTARALRTLTEDSLNVDPLASSATRAWIAAGLIQTTPNRLASFEPRVGVLQAQTSVCDELLVPGSPSSLYAPRFLFEYTAARWQVRHRSVLQIAEFLRRRKQRLDLTTTRASLAQAVQHFNALRPWFFTGKDRCLVHALALTRFLLALRLDATWMIGVRLHPWSAHSWTQSGSVLLDATPEQVREYKPIFAV
jgi:hypothetical protein